MLKQGRERMETIFHDDFFGRMHANPFAGGE